MLTLAHAKIIADAAMAEGCALGLLPLAVVVLDAGGHPLAVQRDERASTGRVEIATAKASACIGMGFGGRENGRRADRNPGFYAALQHLFPRGMIAGAGGVLIRDQAGAILGAVGVTGDTGDNDERAAVAGINAAGLVPDTGAP
jgi:uncharacterized protein GlcG (DUF336 family)